MTTTLAPTRSTLQPTTQDFLRPTPLDAEIAGYILDNGGITYNLRAKNHATWGYSVSPYKAREVRIPVEDFGAGYVAAYRRANDDLLTKSRHYLGGWYNKADNLVYLDVSQVFPVVAAALLVGREAQQQAVFDLLTGEEIPCCQ